MRNNWRWSTPSTMTSWHHFHSTVTQNGQNLTQLQLRSNNVRVHLYAYIPHWKVLKHFLYVQYGCGEQSAVVYSLKHNIMASFPLDSCQELPLTKLQQCNGVRVHLYAYVPHREVYKNTLYISNMDVGSNQRWTTGSTMTSWHHSHLTVTQNC